MVDHVPVFLAAKLVRKYLSSLKIQTQQQNMNFVANNEKTIIIFAIVDLKYGSQLGKIGTNLINL